MALFRRHNQGENKPKTEEEKRRELEVEYHRIIEEAARDEKNFEIYCATTEHYAYVLKTLFKYARNEVCIFTLGFNGDIFDDKDLILEAIKFLNKHEAKFKIAHKESKEDFLRGKFLKSVLNATEKGKVEIWDASKVVPINDSCFCLNDNYSFADGSQNSKANFGNKEVGKFMANLFIEIIIKSERVLS